MILFDYGHGWSVLINPKVIYKRFDHGRQYLITGNYSKNNSIINAFIYITFNKWIEFYVIVILTLFFFFKLCTPDPQYVIFSLLDYMLKLWFTVITDKDTEECIYIYIDCLLFCILLSNYPIAISHGSMYSV